MWLKEQWKMYPWQMIGAALLIPAFVLAFVAQVVLLVVYAAWAVLAMIGGIDVWLIYKAKKKGVRCVTISRWVSNLFGKRVDRVVMFGFMVLVWWLAGPLAALWYLHGFLNDHFNAE